MGILSEPRVLSNLECFEEFPNQWILLQVLERKDCHIVKAAVLETDINKDIILNHSRELKKLGHDVAVISTIETLEDALSIVKFENDMIVRPYLSPKEYAYIWSLLMGYTYNEYLDD